MKGEPLRVCYFGTFRDSYSRNQIMIEGLRRNGVEVVVCHQRLWRGIEDRVQAASGGWYRPGFILRVLRAYSRLLWAYRQVGEYDVMVLGYPGQFDVFLARFLTWLRRRPLVLDVFMSVYLIAFERDLTARHTVSGRLIYWLERLACRLPDCLIQDTVQYVHWFQETFGLDPSRFRLVPTGADDRIFYPADPVVTQDGLFRVLYYGSFIPNHGVEHIVEAAKQLAHHPDIRFHLVGEGPAKAEAMARAQAYGLANVSFEGWLDKHALRARVAEADICLGVFGTTPQSLMTVQNKIYEGLAMGKCVVTGAAPAVCQTLTHGQHVWFCERADPQALAQSILTLRQDASLRTTLEREGHALYLTGFTPAALGQQFAQHLRSVIQGHHG